MLPTIISAIVSLTADLVSVSPTEEPFLNTIILSLTARISLSLCEIKITDKPDLIILRTVENKASVS